MPRFFFDLDDGKLSHRDDNGIEFPTRDHAQTEAARTIREMFLSYVPDIASDEGALQMSVRDGAGQLLFKVAVNFSVRIYA